MTVKMAEMSWHDYEAKIKEDAVVILPVGSTEAHGLHLPLSVDVILASGFAELLAKAVGGVVAPPIVYGYKGETGGGPIYAGTLELNANTLISLVHDVLEELIADGFYFTIGYPGMTGSELMEELMFYGISAISLGTTGSKQEGLRACTSFIKDHQYALLEERLQIFKSNHAHN